MKKSKLNDLPNEDLEVIANFNSVVKSYLKMEYIENLNKQESDEN